MKRTVSALVLASALGGCMTANHSPDANTKPTVRASGEYLTQNLPGVSGPWGEPIPMAAPYSAQHLTPWQAQRMMSQSVPLSWVQMDPGVVQAGAQMPGGGMAPYGMPMMPPGGMMTPPGTPMVPPMGGPGGMGMPPNMQMPNGYAGMGPGMITPATMNTRPLPPPPGAVAAVGAMAGGIPSTSIGRTQIRFTGPDGMKIAWLAQGSGPDCRPNFSAPVVEAPGRYNFVQASIYRLKLTNIRSRPGLEVYPTLEIVPCNPKTAAFLAHSAVPLEFTPQDFQEITEGKFLVKVIYLPDPQYQELAATGTDEIISTRLEPGADPILEAQRRGSILAVIRMGNVDQEAPNTPPLDGSGAPLCAAGPMPPGMMSNGMMANGMMPPGMMPPGMTAGGMMPPGMMPSPAMPGAAPSIPAMPTGRVPSSAPVPFGPISKAPSNSGIQTVSTLPAIPELPSASAKTTAPMPPAAPVPPAPPALPQTSVNVPPPPCVPPTPAELAAQSNQ